MSLVILLAAAVAALVIAGSLVGIVAPAFLINITRRFITPAGLWFAAAIRVLMAVIFWVAAAQASHPMVLQVLAVLFVLAAVGIIVAGHQRIGLLMDWFIAKPSVIIRLVSLLGEGLGVLILIALFA